MACIALALLTPAAKTAWAQDEAAPPAASATETTGPEPEAPPVVMEAVAVEPVVAEEPPPAPTPEPIPGGPTDLSDGQTAAVEAGQTAVYRHTVVHVAGELADAKEVVAVSSLGWRVALYSADGVTPLADTTGNGGVDTGAIPVGGWVEIVVAVTVPVDAAPHVQDVTRLTGSSAGAPGSAHEETVSNATTVLPPPPAPVPSPSPVPSDPAPTAPPDAEPEPSPTPETPPSPDTGDGPDAPGDPGASTGTPDPDPAPSVEPPVEDAAVPLSLALSEGETKDVAAGETVDYRHTVALGDGGGAAVDITAMSLAGWTVALYAEDGVTPLDDRNRDGGAELGMVAPGETRAFVVRVAVPDTVTSGLSALTVVAATAIPGAAAGPVVAEVQAAAAPEPASAEAINVTTVSVPATVSVAMPAGGFGTVGPDGRTTAGGPTSTVDAAGATYVSPGAVVVSVDAGEGQAWGVSCGIVVVEGALARPVEWRVAGSEEWRAFQAAETVCLSGAGRRVIELDIRIRVEWTDPVGDMAWTLRFGA